MKTDYQSLLKNTKIMTLAMFGLWYTVLLILGSFVLLYIKYSGHLMFREAQALNGAPIIFILIFGLFSFMYLLCKLNKIENKSSFILSSTAVGIMLVLLCAISLINNFTSFFIYLVVAIIAYYHGKYLRLRYEE